MELEKQSLAQVEECPNLEMVKLEYPALRAEEQSRENARLQMWTFLFSLVGAFGLASIQDGNVAYLTALFPLMVACLARYTSHGEGVLHQVRKHLYNIEKAAKYVGYEHFCRSYTRPSHGGYKKSLRDAMLLFDVFAVVLVVIHLTVDHLALVSIPVVIVELAAMVLTCIWL